MTNQLYTVSATYSCYVYLFIYMFSILYNYMLHSTLQELNKLFDNMQIEICQSYKSTQLTNINAQFYIPLLQKSWKLA